MRTYDSKDERNSSIQSDLSSFLSLVCNFLDIPQNVKNVLVFILRGNRRLQMTQGTSTKEREVRI
jgi:hypothetical protein